MPLLLDNCLPAVILRFGSNSEDEVACDDVNPFQPIGLDCAVPSADANAVSNQLTAVVTYKTRYMDTAGKPVTLSVGLDKAIKVNAIISLPTFNNGNEFLILTPIRPYPKHSGVISTYVTSMQLKVYQKT